MIEKGCVGNKWVKTHVDVCITHIAKVSAMDSWICVATLMHLGATIPKK